MTHITPREPRRAPPSAEPPPFAWLPHLLAFLHRRWHRMAISLGVCVAVALAYSLTATPRYTAELELLIDISRTDQLRQQTTPHDALTLNSMLESQVQLLQSAGLARQTAKRLGLGALTHFVPVRFNLVDVLRVTLLSLFQPAAAPLAHADPVDVAAQTLLKMMRVRRIGQTYVISIGVTSTSPDEAAWLANGVAETYLSDELRAKEDGIQQANGWLQVRIKELHDEAVTADRAVQEFKAQHNIVDTDKGLMGSQQLTELSTQLGTARTNTAAMQSRLQRIDAIIRDGVDGGGVTDSLDNKVIVTLRQQYVDDDRRVAELTAKFGKDHLAIRDLRNEMIEVKRSIQGELGRIADTYKSDYEVARADEKSVQARLDQMVATAAQTNNDLVDLRSLQSSADTFRTLYQNFLQRYTQAVQDQSFPVPEARVITAAIAPERKSQPKTMLILAFAIALGSGFGFIAAVAREALERGIRDADQLRDATGMECLGLVPRAGRRAVRQAARVTRARARKDAPTPSTWRGDLLRHAINAPRSAFADAVRAVRMQIIYRKPGPCEVKVIGFMPDFPGAGASTISVNLAQALAQAGGKTILVDWDFAKASLSRALIGGQGTGCLDVLAGRLEVFNCIHQDPQSDLGFLSVGYSAAASLPHALAVSEPMHDLMARLRSKYSYVVVDLPPLTTVSEMHYATHLLDTVVIVAEWGSPRLASLIDNLEHVGLDLTKIMGVILNKADLKSWQSDIVRARENAAA
jgi:succinoglycan biosynthesis transport protein ExoP